MNSSWTGQYMIGTVGKCNSLWYIGKVYSDGVVDILKRGPFLSANRAESSLARAIKENRLPGGEIFGREGGK